jgi:hypothetical protein
MRISKYTIAKQRTKAVSNGKYYECANTEENQETLKNCLMPSAVTKNNTLVFPYFN